MVPGALFTNTLEGVVTTGALGCGCACDGWPHNRARAAPVCNVLGVSGYRKATRSRASWDAVGRVHKYASVRPAPQVATPQTTTSQAPPSGRPHYTKTSARCRLGARPKPQQLGGLPPGLQLRRRGQAVLYTRPRNSAAAACELGPGSTMRHRWQASTNYRWCMYVCTPTIPARSATNQSAHLASQCRGSPQKATAWAT